MSKKLIVVDGFSYSLSDPNVFATVTLTGVASVKSKIKSKGICKHNYSAIVTAIYTASATIPDPGPYTVNFSASAQKTKVDGSFVLLVDDKTGDITAIPKIPGSPPTPSPITFYIKITDAGQNKVSTE